MKPKVHYAILEDMQKYVKGFKKANYESSGSKTDEDVIHYLRDYYDNHLPVDVTAWARVNNPIEQLIYGKYLGPQICFVRDKLCMVLNPDYKYWDKNPPLVISHHYSKSVKLPVYQINIEEYGVELILRNNFYDWKISINSSSPLNFNFMGIFDTIKEIPHIFCEGFPKDKVYENYDKNHSQFTLEIRSDYDLYTFFFLLKKYLEQDKI